MAGYFNDIVGGIVPITYTWDAIDAESETWADLLTWADGSGGYSSISSIGVPDIEFYTGIIDFGRTDWVNPLITVVAQGEIVTKVWASETQPSDYISGDPGIIADSVKAIDALYGRYFQFKIEIYNDSAQTAQLKSVTTNLSVATQSEFFQENSGTHPGTEIMRYLPIERQYSKILNISGHAQLVGNPDSTLNYTTVIDDVGPNNITITETGSPSAVTDVYKWSPASIQINDDDGTQVFDTNDSLSIPLSTYITTGQFEISGWMKVKRMDWLDGTSSPPNLAHSPYFLHLDTGGTDIYLKTSTSAGQPLVSYSFDNLTYTDIGYPDGNNPADQWFYWGFARTASGTLRFWVSTSYKITFIDVSGYTQSLSGATLKIGDLGGNATVGEYWFDDVAVYNANQNYIGAPGAAKIVNSSTVFLMNGATAQVVSSSNIPIVTVGALTNRTEPRYAVYRASGDPVDADVALQVTGLKGMNCDGAGSITEVA